jgi:hypothetical protein
MYAGFQYADTRACHDRSRSSGAAACAPASTEKRVVGKDAEPTSAMLLSKK